MEVVYLPENAMNEFMHDSSDRTVAVRVSVSRLNTVKQVVLMGLVHRRASRW